MSDTDTKSRYVQVDHDKVACLECGGLVSNTETHDGWHQAVLAGLSGSDRRCMVLHSPYCMTLGGDTPCTASTETGGTPE